MVITKGLYLSSRREKIGEVWEGHLRILCGTVTTPRLIQEIKKRLLHSLYNIHVPQISQEGSH